MIIKHKSSKKSCLLTAFIAFVVISLFKVTSFESKARRKKYDMAFLIINFLSTKIVHCTLDVVKVTSVVKKL